MEENNGSALNPTTTTQDVINPLEKLELHCSPSSNVEVEVDIDEQESTVFVDCRENKEHQHPPSCLNLTQRKKKHSKDQHVHFTFDDFHYFSSQDESTPSNVYTTKYQIQRQEQNEVEDFPDSKPDEYENASEEYPTYCLGYTKRQWSILIVFVFAQTVSAILISLLGPLFPIQAQLRGSSATEFGLVFAIFELTVFLVSPICTEHMEKIGPKLVFNMGIFITGICAVIFGFLDRIDDRVVFIPLSISIILVAALGDAAFLTSSYTIIISEFPKSIGQTLALKEAFFGFGLIIGPIIGGILNQVGGFMFTFLVMGTFQLVIAVITLLGLPHMVKIREIQPESAYGIITILRIPSVALTALVVFGSAVSVGFLTPTLEPHIRQFGLSSAITGAVYIISAGVYFITAPIFGWICDKVVSARVVSVLGTISILIGFILIGPAPFLQFEPTLETTAIGLAIHGLGISATLVASFRQALQQTLKYNFPDNIETHGLVSSLWTLFYSLGNIVGPIISGVLFDHIGFRHGTWVIMIFQVFVLFTTFGFFICCTKIRRLRNQSMRSRSAKDEGTERELLLGTIDEEG